MEEGGSFGIYNAAFLFENGTMRVAHRKTYPPTYGMFEEMRYFSRGKACVRSTRLSVASGAPGPGPRTVAFSVAVSAGARWGAGHHLPHRESDPPGGDRGEACVCIR